MDGWVDGRAAGSVLGHVIDDVGQRSQQIDAGWHPCIPCNQVIHAFQGTLSIVFLNDLCELTSIPHAIHF